MSLTPTDLPTAMNWRHWFPWPIGTHWCWYETSLALVVGTVFGTMAILVALTRLGILP